MEVKEGGSSEGGQGAPSMAHTGEGALLVLVVVTEEEVVIVWKLSSFLCVRIQ
jgi:hypothetical protein